MKRLIALGVAGIALAGCGSGRSQTQIRACWNHNIAQFVREYDSRLGAGVGDQVIPTVAVAYEAGAGVYAKYVSGGLTTPEYTARFRSIERICGKLHVATG